jgi:threonine dehydratase
MERDDRSVGAGAQGAAAEDLIARADVPAARLAIAGVAVRTPTLLSADLSDRAGTPVALKAECLQGTGSFKLRGALNKVAALGDGASPGLVTASAGNHARALAETPRTREAGGLIGGRCARARPRVLRAHRRRARSPVR